MAWDPPAAFTVSEVVTAAKMNQIRDSLLYLKGGAGEISLDNHLKLNGAYELRFGSSGDVNLYRHDSGTLRTDDALRVGGGMYGNGGVITVLEAFVMAQSGNKMIYVSAENITSSTVTLATGITRGVGGPVSAYGSTFGWSTIASNAAVPGAGSTACASFNAGAFVVEVTSAGVLQARRVSGSETWTCSCILNVR